MQDDGYPLKWRIIIKLEDNMQFNTDNKTFFYHILQFFRLKFRNILLFSGWYSLKIYPVIKFYDQICMKVK